MAASFVMFILSSAIKITKQFPYGIKKFTQGHVLWESTVSGWLGFSYSIGGKLFSLGLVGRLFQAASNHVETVEKKHLHDYITRL